ncbi:ABC transporter substrate-binding protein [Carpediemonas membranifera]|uniref:ABC transporter substrate-binding protein n=1 Tax=Carpediemonas membranifera TaxID=201153 RepID=A0A8J6B2G5_9EUKA|nr:ABC transporter substrate-binding protein [Carpediemonas membranifera]|eukprot:KAG9396990.1 ABC transporter substrate-binding protein [Carpediemonas membranifera]
MRDGILAAFASFNAAQSVYNMSLISYDDGYTPANTETNTNKLIGDDGVFALIGYTGTPTVSAVIDTVLAAEMPLIGSFTGARFLRHPFEPLAMNVRASYDDEVNSIVDYAVGFGRTNVAAFIQADAFGTAGINALGLALGKYNLPIIGNGTYERNTVEVEPGLAALEASLNGTTPDLVVMIGTAYALAKFVSIAQPLYPDTLFYTVSFVGSTVFADELLHTYSGINFDNIIVSQVMPFFHGQGYSILPRYEAEMAAHQPAATLGFGTLEGWLAGTMVCMALERVDTSGGLTVDLFMDTVYNTGLFYVEDVRLGPYGYECSGDQAYSGCSCNQGQHFVYLSTIEPNGTYALLERDYFSYCGAMVAEEAVKPLVIGQIADMSGSAASIGKGMRAGIAAAFKEANDAVLFSFPLILRTFNDGYDASRTPSCFTTLIDEGVALIAGTVGTPTTKSLLPLLNATGTPVPLVGPFTGLRALREEAAVVNYRASYDAEVAAMVAHAGDTQFVIFMQNDSFGQAGLDGLTLSLEFINKTIVAQGTYEWGTTDVSDAVTAIFDDSELDITREYAVIMIGTANALAAFVEAVDFKLSQTQMNLGSFYSLSFVGLETYSGFIGQHVYDGNYKNIYASSVVPSPLDFSVDFSDTALHSIMTSDASQFAAVEGYLVGSLLIQILVRMGAVAASDVTGPAFLEAVAGSFTLADSLVVGSFTSSCNQGMRQVQMLSMRSGDSLPKDYQTVSWPDGADWFTFDTCTIAEGLLPATCTAGYEPTHVDSVYVATQCSACITGTYSVSGTSCDACPAGSFAADLASTVCDLCDPGSYQDRSGSGQCITCDSFSYSSESGATSCVACPDSSMVTVSGGATTLADCMCLGGYFGNASIEACTACPDGATCCADASCLYGVVDPLPQPGYYKYDRDTFLACIPADACLGSVAQYGDDVTADEDAANVCSDGYGGFLCGECDTQFFRADSMCQQCSGSFVMDFSRGVGLLIVIFIAAFCISVCSTLLQVTMPLLDVLLDFFKLTTILSLVDITWPGKFLALFSLAGLFNLNIDSVAPSCVSFLRPLFTDIYARAIVWLAVPVAYAILCVHVFVFFICLGFLIGRPSRLISANEMSSYDLFRSIVSSPSYLYTTLMASFVRFLNMMFPGILLQLVSPFICSTQNGVTYNSRSPHIMCSGLEWNLWRVVITIVTLTLGMIPLALFLIASTRIRSIRRNVRLAKLQRKTLRAQRRSSRRESRMNRRGSSARGSFTASYAASSTMMTNQSSRSSINSNMSMASFFSSGPASSAGSSSITARMGMSKFITDKSGGYFKHAIWPAILPFKTSMYFTFSLIQLRTMTLVIVVVLSDSVITKLIFISVFTVGYLAVIVTTRAYRRRYHVLCSATSHMAFSVLLWLAFTHTNETITSSHLTALFIALLAFLAVVIFPIMLVDLTVLFPTSLIRGAVAMLQRRMTHYAWGRKIIITLEDARDWVVVQLYEWKDKYDEWSKKRWHQAADKRNEIERRDRIKAKARATKEEMAKKAVDLFYAGHFDEMLEFEKTELENIRRMSEKKEKDKEKEKGRRHSHSHGEHHRHRRGSKPQTQPGVIPAHPWPMDITSSHAEPVPVSDDAGRPPYGGVDRRGSVVEPFTWSGDTPRGTSDSTVPTLKFTSSSASTMVSNIASVDQDPGFMFDGVMSIVGTEMVPQHIREELKNTGQPPMVRFSSTVDVTTTVSASELTGYNVDHSPDEELDVPTVLSANSDQTDSQVEELAQFSNSMTDSSDDSYTDTGTRDFSDSGSDSGL